MIPSRDEKLLSGDKPLSDPKDDCLEYAPFAKTIAKSICNMVPPEGLVMGLYGDWGLGKSTFINFIIHYLKEKPESEKIAILQFNPWWFSGQDDLVQRFLKQLQLTLMKEFPGLSLDQKIKDFTAQLYETPGLYGQLIKMFYKVFEYKKSGVQELKTQIEGILRKRKKKILIIIDDIDRLTSEEIRQLFKAIKAVGDFPNIIYLLAFEKSVVIKALESMQGGSGEDYLEKIIQVPWELPIASKTHLRKLFFNKLDLILKNSPEELFDKTYWSNVYFDGIDNHIKTPRNIA